MPEFLVSESIQSDAKTESCVAAADNTLLTVKVAVLRHTTENTSLFGCRLFRQQVLDHELSVLRQPIACRLDAPRLHSRIEPSGQPQLRTATRTHGMRGLQLGSNGVLELSRLMLLLRLSLVAAVSTLDLSCSEGLSRLLALVPQGRVPWLLCQHRHWGHVLHKLRTWSHRFS